MTVQASQGTAPDGKSIVKIDKQKTTRRLEIYVLIPTEQCFKSERQGIIKGKKL